MAPPLVAASPGRRLLERPALVFVLAQIGFDHLRVLFDLGRIAIGDEPAEIQHQQTPADGEDRSHIVADDDEGLAAPVHFEDRVEDDRHQFRVAAG